VAGEIASLAGVVEVGESEKLAVNLLFRGATASAVFII
jgi:hypothetical protein